MNKLLIISALLLAGCAKKPDVPSPNVVSHDAQYSSDEGAMALAASFTSAFPSWDCKPNPAVPGWMLCNKKSPPKPKPVRRKTAPIAADGDAIWQLPRLFVQGPINYSDTGIEEGACSGDAGCTVYVPSGGMVQIRGDDIFCTSPEVCTVTLPPIVCTVDGEAVAGGTRICLHGKSYRKDLRSSDQGPTKDTCRTEGENERPCTANDSLPSGVAYEAFGDHAEPIKPQEPKQDEMIPNPWYRPATHLHCAFGTAVYIDGGFDLDCVERPSSPDQKGSK